MADILSVFGFDWLYLAEIGRLGQFCKSHLNKFDVSKFSALAPPSALIIPSIGSFSEQAARSMAAMMMSFFIL